MNEREVLQYRDIIVLQYEAIYSELIVLSIHCDHVEFHDLFPHWMIVSSELMIFCWC